ncbi:polymer-forming cytoskeletal protein [Halorubrum sp. SD626R]|uniref:polymer-forming cytoskeletal protein n=1 Tax=Halorubrum sp. SD626R TaxID=1419722 RepID=UPI000A5B8BAE|nr:polymer-forming cytoskeletal protein [Halorubrum sp. SD626R]TKX80730.1 acyltransferase [Halorubrum sp. SD626R]
MSLRGDGPIEELAVPSGTTVEEHDLVVDGDVLVGGQSTVEFGLRGRNVAIGERVRVGNDIEAEGDCRLDTWCTVDGNVLVGEDAYLGERVTVTGRLMVSGDLDIGDDVSIEEGFEANGWIVIRNPVPTIVFYFIVLSQLLRVGETDAADELAEALADGDDVRDPLLVPRGAEISDDAWRVSTPATVGDDCRIHGNLRAESVRVGERNEVFGSLRAREGITIGADTVIHGDVTTRGGTVTIEAGAHVRGDVSAGDLVVHDGAEIDGSLRARGEMKLVQETGSEAEDAESTESDDDAAGGTGADAESGGDGVDADIDGAESDDGEEADPDGDEVAPDGDAAGDEGDEVDESASAPDESDGDAESETAEAAVDPDAEAT